MILTADQIAALRAEAASDRPALVARMVSRINAAQSADVSVLSAAELERSARYARAALSLLGERRPASVEDLEEAPGQEATP